MVKILLKEEVSLLGEDVVDMRKNIKYANTLYTHYGSY